MTSRSRASAEIHPDTVLGTVRLTVSDLQRSRSFYEQAIGLHAVELDGGTVALGVPNEPPLIELHGDRSAPDLDRRATGLYHLAILLPTRRDLAFALARIAEARWPLDGASDHLVSEALYLSDPDGNGLEVYRDRPREHWPRSGERLEMATLPLDLDSVLAELASSFSAQRLTPPGTAIGHVHLQVSNLSDAESFYSNVLGFDVVVRGYPGALFVSAGGYHHHIGLNTWHSAAGDPPSTGSIGLRNFEIVLPGEHDLQRVLAALRSAGFDPQQHRSDWLVRDPFGIGIVLRTR